jgi:hypothetical protein
VNATFKNSVSKYPIFETLENDLFSQESNENGNWEYYGILK